MAKFLLANKKRDNYVFRRTASKSKKINIDPKVFRGGIRL